MLNSWFSDHYILPNRSEEIEVFQSLSLRTLSVFEQIESGTKQPILKRDKTADFQNRTKQPIFKTGQNSRFSKRNKEQNFRDATMQSIIKTKKITASIIRLLQ